MTQRPCETRTAYTDSPGPRLQAREYSSCFWKSTRVPGRYCQFCKDLLGSVRYIIQRVWLKRQHINRPGRTPPHKKKRTNHFARALTTGTHPESTSWNCHMLSLSVGLSSDFTKKNFLASLLSGVESAGLDLEFTIFIGDTRGRINESHP